MEWSPDPHCAVNPITAAHSMQMEEQDVFSSRVQEKHAGLCCKVKITAEKHGIVLTIICNKEERIKGILFVVAERNNDTIALEGLQLLLNRFGKTLEFSPTVRLSEICRRVSVVCRKGGIGVKEKTVYHILCWSVS